MANSVDPDETRRSVASHLGLHCLLRPVGPNTYGKVKHSKSHAPTVSQKGNIITKSLLITNYRSKWQK